MSISRRSSTSGLILWLRLSRQPEHVLAGSLMPVEERDGEIETDENERCPCYERRELWTGRKIAAVRQWKGQPEPEISQEAGEYGVD
jgi:hypothetical protein